MEVVIEAALQVAKGAKTRRRDATTTSYGPHADRICRCVFDRRLLILTINKIFISRGERGGRGAVLQRRLPANR